MSTPVPLIAVRDAVAAGATTFEEISRRTGMPGDLVPLAVDRLVGLGLLASDRLQVGCPDGGCGGCSSSSEGSACATGGPAAPGGLVMLTLGRRPGP